MTIDEPLISNLEKLARLHLSPEERISLMKDLNDILKMVDKLHELNTEDVEPLIYLNMTHNPWRKDKVGEELSQENATKNAPLTKDGFFKVPKVLKHTSNE